MNSEKLSIVPLEIVDEKIIQDLLSKLEDVFEITTDQVAWNSISRLEKSKFKSGLKYRSTELINYFSKNIPERINRILFITFADLYSPVFARYYGEAQLNGKVGIVSGFYLNKNLGEGSKDSVIFMSRLKKEAVHEVGHLFGLTHCTDPNCVMNLSGKPGDIDVKSSSLCKNCSEVLRNTTATV